MRHLTTRKSFRILLVAVLMSSSLSLIPAPGFCEGEEQPTPRSISEQSFAALKAGKSDDFAKLMLPSELERFKSGMLVIADMAKAKEQESKIFAMFEVPDRESLEKLSAEEFLSKIMKKQMSPEMLEMYTKANFRIMDVFMEGDDVAHVVYMLAIPDLITKSYVTSYKKGDAGWGMMLSGDMDKMVQLMKIQFAKPGAQINFDAKVKAVKVLGSVMDGGEAHVAVRSTSTINGIDVNKVAVVTVEKTEPEYKLLVSKDKAALQKAFEKKFGVYADFAKAAVKLHNVASGAAKPGARKPAVTKKSTK